jgi:hypothetical protein
MTRTLCTLWIALVWLWFLDAPRLPRPKLRRSWGALAVVGGIVLGVRVQVLVVGVR